MEVYRINADVGFSLVYISDFHDRDPYPVINTIQSISTNLILIAGDTFERHDPRISTYTYKEMNDWQGLSSASRKTGHMLKFLNRFTGKVTGRREHVKADEKSDNGHILLRALSQIAPVFMSVGNHEWYFEKRDYQLFRDCGITLLDNSDVVWNGIRIGGLSTRYDVEWLREYSEKDGYKILLCHHPEYVDRYCVGLKPFNLILAGHAHGGQWRIGRIGLYGSGQGFFPKYCHGEYQTKAGQMIVSSGVSVTSNIPRIGNPCEIVVIEPELRKKCCSSSQIRCGACG